MKKKLALACTDCGSRNYTKDVSDKVRTERLEIKNIVVIVKNIHYTVKQNSNHVVKGAGSIYE